MPDLSLEGKLGGRVAGIDEVGCGSLAGPVVAASVVINTTDLPIDFLAALDDSKKLRPIKREALFTALVNSVNVGVGQASVAEIDSLNIRKATFLAMMRSIENLTGDTVDHAIVDGCLAPTLYCRTTTLIKGDQISASVAAASIVAKVTRDHLMLRLAKEYPGYGWETNKGYGTQQHLSAITSLGITPFHRRSFAPICYLYC